MLCGTNKIACGSLLTFGQASILRVGLEHIPELNGVHCNKGVNNTRVTGCIHLSLRLCLY